MAEKADDDCLASLASWSDALPEAMASHVLEALKQMLQHTYDTLEKQEVGLSLEDSSVPGAVALDALIAKCKKGSSIMPKVQWFGDLQQACLKLKKKRQSEMENEAVGAALSAYLAEESCGVSGFGGGHCRSGFSFVHQEHCAGDPFIVDAFCFKKSPPKKKPKLVRAGWGLDCISHPPSARTSPQTALRRQGLGEYCSSLVSTVQRD